MLSIFLISLGTVQSLASYEMYFRWAEYSIVTIFTLEYIARIYIHEDRFKYIFSPFGIIDFISIAPSLLGLTNFTFLRAARIARLLSFLRLSRMAKLARMNKNAKFNSLKARDVRVISIRIYAIVLVSAIFIFGSLLYLVEGAHNTNFVDIPSAVIWATLALLGSSINPENLSYLGKIVVIVLQFSSLMLFGLMIHIVGRFIEHKLLGSSSIDR